MFFHLEEPAMGVFINYRYCQSIFSKIHIFLCSYVALFALVGKNAQKNSKKKTAAENAILV